MDLGRWSDLSISDCQQLGVGERALVGRTNRGGRVHPGPVVRRNPRGPSDVVCRDSRAQQRESDLHRTSNQLNLESGWYADIDPQMTYDWTADNANAWLIPMGADVGKAFTLGSQSFERAGWRLRSCQASGHCPAVDNARQHNLPLPLRA
jgi:hypothetical protein